MILEGKEAFYAILLIMKKVKMTNNYPVGSEKNSAVSVFKYLSGYHNAMR